MTATRYDVVLSIRPEAAPDPEALVPVWHRWIQQEATGELLIDVVDYRHVHHGPAVVLVAHRCHYAYDLSEGRPGLRYSLRRGFEADTPQAYLLAACRGLLEAARLLAGQAPLGLQVAFDTAHLAVRIPDRLAAPNTPEGRAAWTPHVETLAARLYADAPTRITPWGEPRAPLGWRIEAGSAPSLETLQQRLA